MWAGTGRECRQRHGACGLGKSTGSTCTAGRAGRAALGRQSALRTSVQRLYHGAQLQRRTRVGGQQRRQASAAHVLSHALLLQVQLCW